MAFSGSTNGNAQRTSGQITPTGHTSMCWFRTGTTVSSSTDIYRLTSGGATDRVRISSSIGAWQLRTDFEDDWYETSALPTNTWYHLAFQRNGNNRTLFVNGVSTLTLNGANTLTNPTEAWGNDNSGSSTNGGRIACVKQWNAILSTAEIQREMLTILPCRWADLHTVSPFFNTGRLENLVGQGWSASGTIASEDGPPVSWGAPILLFSPLPADAEPPIVLSVQAGVINLGGQEAYGELAVESAEGQIRLIGQEVGLILPRSLDVEAGGMTLAGQDVGLEATAHAFLAVEAGEVALTGQDVTLAATAHVVMAVEAADLVLAGQDVNLGATADTALEVEAAGVLLTGQDVDLSVTAHRVLAVEAGAVSLAGQDVDLLAGDNLVLSVDAGQVTLTGSDVGLSVPGMLPVDAGSVSLVGQEVGMHLSLRISAGGVVANGSEMAFTLTLTVEPGQIALEGQEVEFDYVEPLVLSVEAGLLEITGANVNLIAGLPKVKHGHVSIRTRTATVSVRKHLHA